MLVNLFAGFIHYWWSLFEAATSGWSIPISCSKLYCCFNLICYSYTPFSYLVRIICREVLMMCHLLVLYAINVCSLESMLMLVLVLNFVHYLVD